MDLRLSKMWQERVWSRECVIYCFQRWVCNAQITLSEDVIIQCRLLYNLTVSSTLTFVFWILFETPWFHSQSCAVPSVNLPVLWRDRRHEIMRALMNIFQLEVFWRIGPSDTARRLFCHFLCNTNFCDQSTERETNPVCKQSTFDNKQLFFFISLNLHSLSLSPSLLKANQTNRWPSSNSGLWAAADASCTDGSCQLRWHVARNHSKCTRREMEARKLGKWWKFGLTPPAGTENYFLRCRTYKLLGCGLCGAFKCMFLDEVMQQSTFDLRHCKFADVSFACLWLHSVAVRHQSLAFTYKIDDLLRLLPSQNKPQVDLLTPSLKALHVLWKSAWEPSVLIDFRQKNWVSPCR